MVPWLSFSFSIFLFGSLSNDQSMHGSYGANTFSSFICFSSTITQEKQNLHYNTKTQHLCIGVLLRIYVCTYISYRLIQAYIPNSIKMIMIIIIIITVVVLNVRKKFSIYMYSIHIFICICPTMYGRTVGWSLVGRLLVSSSICLSTECAGINENVFSILFRVI